MIGSKKKETTITSSSINFNSRLIFTLIFAAIIFYAGCQSKKEEAKSPEEKTTQVDTQTVKNQPVLKPAAKEETKIPDITGTWTGKFDSKVTTLKITTQDSTLFKGKITIHYREAVNQEVKGTFSPDKLTLNMSDQIRERYMGKYSANLSTDLKKLTGTFTMKYR